MKIAHISDVHYCPKHLEEVDRCMRFAVASALSEKCECAVISGDLFDHRVDLHSPCVEAALMQVHTLAEFMPVLILQGTYSHDVPGSLDVFRHLGATHEVFVADRIGQVGLVSTFDQNQKLHTSRFVSSAPHWTFGVDGDGDITWPPFKALFSCLPSVNKAEVAATVGTEDVGTAVGEHVANLLRGWSVPNLQARLAGIPTIVVTHGTVSGCVTEHGVPMAGFDHEFTTGSLFAAEASAVMIGHIHKYQVWKHNGRVIAYPGSVGRLHFGEMDDKGFLLWNVYPDSAHQVLVETPAKKLLEIEFPGAPDMAELLAFASKAHGAHVRVRYTLDEEHRHSVDRAAIDAMFVNAAELKIEPHINPIQRTRSAGINRAPSLADKLAKWCDVTAVDAAPLQERLDKLMHMEPEHISAQVVKS